MEKTMHCFVQRSIPALVEKSVVPFVFAAHWLFELPALVNCIGLFTPEKFHAVSCHFRRRRDWIGVQSSTADGFDLPPVAKQQDIDTTERPLGAIRSFLVNRTLADDLSDDEFQLTKQLRCNHA